ncbi:ribonuclease P [Candidatus Woesearchaeota archaeon]|nr:ribonuclease P [Candidatus Woesearchaeota archaeon]
MKRRYNKKSAEHKKIARERIEVLFKQAKDTFKEDAKLSDRYVHLARKIAMKYKVRIKPELKRRFCKHCYRYLMPGITSRVRMQKGKVVYFCFSCKKFMRFPHIKKK